MSTIEAVIKRHSALIYFALVFVISWGGGFLILGPRGFPLNPAEFENLEAALYAANLAGPCLAGLLLTGMVHGRPGLSPFCSSGSLPGCRRSACSWSGSTTGPGASRW